MTWKEIDCWEELKEKLNAGLNKQPLEINDMNDMVDLAKDTINTVLTNYRKKTNSSKGLPNLYKRLIDTNLLRDKLKLLSNHKGHFSAWDSDLQGIFGKLLESYDNLKAIEVKKENEKKEAISKCTQSIDKISDQITLEDKSKIEEARNAYDKLDSDQKQQVTNYGKLTKAEHDLKTIEIEKENKDVSECEKLVDKINIKDMPSEKDLDLWCPEIPNAYKMFSSLNEQLRNRVSNKQKLLNIMAQARKVEDERIKIVNQFINNMKANKVIEWSQKLSVALGHYHNFFGKEYKEKVNQNALNDALKQLFENRARELKVNGKITSEIGKKIDELHSIHGFLSNDKKNQVDKDCLEKFNDAKKIYDVDTSISRILDDKFVQSQTEIDKVKENFKEIDRLTDRISRYDEFIEYEKKLKELNICEDKIEKYKYELAKIKEPLKDLSKFYSNHTKEFDDKFSEQILSGLNLCLKYDSHLKSYYTDNKFESDLKSDLSKNDVKTLKKICEYKWITNTSKDYLLFMISMIECKKLYSAKTNDEIKYDDPSKDNLDADKTKFLNELNNESDTLPKEIKQSLKDIFIKNDLVEIGKTLISIYSYLNDSKYPDNNSLCKHWILKDWCSKDEHYKVIDKIVGQFSDKELTSEKKTCIEGMEVFNRVNSYSDMEECKNPIWNIDAGKPNLSTNDLKQGSIGDCWLIATLISIVKNNPDNILKCFPNRDKEIDKVSGKLTGKHITVRLYEVMLTAHRKKDGRLRSYARPIRPIKIKMSNTIYHKRNETSVSWPNFIEKAISVYRGKKLLKTAVIDENIGDFGKQTINNAKQLWLMRSEGNYNLQSGTTDGIIHAVLLGTTGGGFTLNIDYLKNNLREKLIKKNAAVSFSQKFKVNDTEFTTKHEYAITSVDNDNVYLFNPHDGSKQLSMPIDTFCTYCLGISFGHSSKS